MKLYQIRMLDSSYGKRHFEKVAPLIERDMKDQNPELTQLVLKATFSLIKTQLFNLNTQMDMPTAIAIKDGQKYAICSSGRMLTTRYENNNDPSYNDLIESLYSDFKVIMPEGHTFFPYVPLAAVQILDPNTFVPKIAFKTRYAILEGDARILTEAEERELTRKQNEAWMLQNWNR